MPTDENHETAPAAPEPIESVLANSTRFMLHSDGLIWDNYQRDYVSEAFARVEMEGARANAAAIRDARLRAERDQIAYGDKRIDEAMMQDTAQIVSEHPVFQINPDAVANMTAKELAAMRGPIIILPEDAASKAARRDAQIAGIGFTTTTADSDGVITTRHIPIGEVMASAPTEDDLRQGEMSERLIQSQKIEAGAIAALKAAFPAYSVDEDGNITAVQPDPMVLPARDFGPWVVGSLSGRDVEDPDFLEVDTVDHGNLLDRASVLLRLPIEVTRWRLVTNAKAAAVQPEETVSMVLNPDMVAAGYTYLIISMLEHIARRLEVEIQTPEGEAADRDMVIAVMMMMETMGEAAPADVKAWLHEHAALLQRCGASLEAAQTMPEEPITAAEAAAADQLEAEGRRLLELLAIFVDDDRHAEPYANGRIPVAMDPWELDEIAAILAGMLDVYGPVSTDHRDATHG